MEFKKYSKIKRLGDEENTDILNGTVHVQEKLDGCNASIWMGSDNNIHYGSRNNDLGFVVSDSNSIHEVKGVSFRGFGEWVANFANNNLGLYYILNQGDRIYGEWLVKHNVEYKPEFINCFYAYDVEINGKFIDVLGAYEIFSYIGIETAPYISVISNPTLDYLNELVGQSTMAITKGEGIVIKNDNYINRFGRQAFAKIVREEFKEVKSKPIIDPDDVIKSLVNKFVTEARVIKITTKIVDEKNVSLSMKILGETLGRCWHDMIEEEIHAIIKFVKMTPLDFSQFKRHHDTLVKQIFISIMENKT